MFKSIGTLTVICTLCLGASPAASAHDRSHDRYASPHHQHVIIHREPHMPRWLRRDRGFRAWYRRTALRHDVYLAWPQLFAIYRWERRYDHRHDHAVHYGSRRHDFDWYRRYWHERDRHHHDRRGHTKRKHRHDSRHQARRDARRGYRHDD
jgi:hypothetical protein